VARTGAHGWPKRGVAPSSIAFRRAPLSMWGGLHPAGAAKFKSGARDVSNPFDNQDGVFVVLTNDRRQYSIWPAATETPAGWSVVSERDTRDASIEYINTNWTDMRPCVGDDVRY
jgi:MbtH protein